MKFRIVATILVILRPEPATSELVLTDVHPECTVEQARAATGWPLQVADDLAETAAPTTEELRALAALKAA